MNRSLTMALAVTLISTASVASANFWLLGTNNNVTGFSADGSRGIGSVGTTSYWRWTPGGGQESIGGTASAGNARLSNDGTTAVGTAINPGNNLAEISRYDWASNGWTTLGSLGSSSGTSASTGWGISGDGSTLVGLGWISAGTAHAIYHRNGTLTSLGSTVTGRSSRANGANLDGTTIVGWQDGSTGFRQGAVWVNGTQTLIFDTANNPMGEASDVSADGQWVTGSGVSSNNFEAWRWSQATGYQSLGAPLVAGDRMAGVAISDDGNTIVGFSRPFGPATQGRGFLWRNGIGLVNLTTYAQSLGINTLGENLSLPLAMSADGNTIGGLTQTGRGFIVQLNAVPEPGTMALIGLGALAAFRRLRRS